MSSTRAPRRRRSHAREILSFGGRVDVVVGAILATVVGASLVVAVASRHGFPASLIPLVPERVFAFELWRLFTWVLVESSPIALLFAALFLYWFGGDLCVAWGQRRFLRVYVGLTVWVAALTSLLGFLDRDVMGAAYLGTLALSSGLVVAWGLLHPEREIRLYFLIPITGHWLVGITAFMTVAYGAYLGWEVVLPSLLAEGSMAAYVLAPRARRRRRPAGPKRVPRVEIGRRGEIRLVEDDD